MTSSFDKDINYDLLRVSKVFKKKSNKNYAFSFTGGPLHLGDIETVGEANILCVVCPWHKWKVDITNGRLKVPAGRGKRNETYPVRVNLEDGSIAIGFAAFNDELLSGMEVDF